jgi:hypothetical protein
VERSGLHPTRSPATTVRQLDAQPARAADAEASRLCREPLDRARMDRADTVARRLAAHARNRLMRRTCGVGVRDVAARMPRGRFDPSARVAIDKPPVDLWLQVALTKLLGFGAFARLLPAALGGTLAVVALYDLLRTLISRRAGLVGARPGGAADRGHLLAQRQAVDPCPRDRRQPRRRTTARRRRVRARTGRRDLDSSRKQLRDRHVRTVSLSGTHRLLRCTSSARRSDSRRP